MTINLKRTTVLVTLLTVICMFASTTTGQQTFMPASQQLRAISYKGDMPPLLSQLAEEFNITIGLEVGPQQPKPEVDIKLRDATLHDVLNAIVRAEPRYQWREDGEFINVYPVEGRSPLLNIVVSSFQVNDVNQAGATNQLMNLPEVQAGMKASNLSHRDFSRTLAGRRGGKFSLRLEDVTLREALHEIAKQSGGRFWAF